jgi:iron complex outermembrane receptor protein
VDDHRDFSGLYGLVEWQPAPRLSVELGARLNQTRETRSTSTLDLASGDWTGGSDSHTDSRLTGSLGLTWTLWQEGADSVRLFGNAKNAFKPAAVDFGLDSEAQILKPESARSFELGLKGRFFGGKLSTELAAFRMDMDNMVISTTGADGLPVLQNAGQQRFQGVEWSLAALLAPDFFLRTAYSYHDARFTNFVFEFDPGVPTQLAGNRLEMSPFHLGSLALTFAPARGLTASFEAAYNGPVWMDKRNSAPAGGYTTLGASVGWRAPGWELRLTGTNLTDRRNPVSESELGDAEYYRMPGRRADASVRFRF